MEGERRRRTVAMIAVLAAVTGAMGVSAAAGGGGGRPSLGRVLAEWPSAPTTATTTAGVAAEEPTASSASQSTTSSSSAPPSTTTTTRYCHNSSDPRCGPFRWVGDPGPNEPATDVIDWTPKVPTVGEDVTFTVTWDDPDSPLLLASENVCVGDRTTPCVAATSFIQCDRYGPWDLPARQPFHQRWTTHHTFVTAGVFSITNNFKTTSNHCAAQFDPYGSEAWFRGAITVEPATTTTMSTPTTTTTTTR